MSYSLHILHLTSVFDMLCGVCYFMTALDHLYYLTFFDGGTVPEQYWHSVALNTVEWHFAFDSV